MAGKGGGAWKVAYADFVTAMMAFFLVMWITAQSNAVKQSVARYFEHPFDATSRSPVPSSGSSGASLIPLEHSLDGNPPHSVSKGKAAFGGGLPPDRQPPAENAPKSGGLRRRSGFMLREEDPSGMGNVILFSDDSVELDDRGREMLSEMLPLFSGKRNKIEIRGITLVPTVARVPAASGNQSQADSWKASYDRCQAVMKYLTEHEIDPNRLRLSQTSSVAAPKGGDPIDSSNNPRVEVYMLSEYADEYQQHFAEANADKPTPTAEQPANPESKGTPTEAKPAGPPAAASPP